jgi:uncharacterized protein with NRDE domain
MCLLVLAWKTHPAYPLILAGNRDERHARASTAAGFWPDAPQVLAGRDLEAGGTWLGTTVDGRFAVVTNYREGPDPSRAPRSRGALTAGFLGGDDPLPQYLAQVQERAGEYGGFSLICGDHESLWYLSNRGPAPAPVAPGIHALSNHLLDTPWPKVEVAKARLRLLLDSGAFTTEALFRLLADRTPAPRDAPLPDTGIDPELERRVSAAFVQHPLYGTRCSTLLLRDQRGGMRFAERRFDAAGEELETRLFHIAGREP